MRINRGPQNRKSVTVLEEEKRQLPLFLVQQLRNV